MERTVTAIKVQKRNTGRVSIDLDGEFAFGLSRITAGWLKVGDRLSEERISALQRADVGEIALQRALLLLGYRQRSEREIRQRLAQKEFTDEQIDEVIEKLKRTNLIRDDEFARSWVDNRNISHPRGKRLMRYELQQKGISEEYIEKALAGSAGDDELAHRAAEQYARKLAGLDRETYRKRLSGYLARKGFSYETITLIVTEFWQQQATILITKNEEV